MLARADKEGYAVPAFNYSDVWDLLAILEAAAEMRAPVMLACNPLVAARIGADICGAMGGAAMERAPVQAVHHLDHAFEPAMCLEAIKHGYPSVMIDASKYELHENIRIVNTVVPAAHAAGVHVEAEIGRIRGRGIEGDFKGGDYLVCPDEAVRLVEETRIDSLAVGIGTAHGFYDGKPEINFDRLRKVNRVVKVPLVLHGGTGIPRKAVRRAISLGINKVNVGTIIHSTYMNGMREELDRLGPNPYTLDVVKPVTEKIKAVVADWIGTCMCGGKGV
jgi:ketose-bisphosphate aldolase